MLENDSLRPTSWSSRDCPRQRTALSRRSHLMRLKPGTSEQRRRNSFREAVSALGLVLAVATGGTFLLPSELAAQGARNKKGAETEKITGKVAEIEKKGKASTLTSDKDDGSKVEVLFN